MSSDQGVSLAKNHSHTKHHTSHDHSKTISSKKPKATSAHEADDDCETNKDPCNKVNELSAPCNQTLPRPRSNFTLYKISNGEGNVCNCNRLYYDTLRSCTSCLNNSKHKVIIQPLWIWKNSCAKFGTPFTDFPPLNLMSSDTGTGNTTRITSISDTNTVDILIVVCVFESVLILIGIGYFLYHQLYKKRIKSKKLNDSITNLLQSNNLNLSNIQHQLDQQHLLFQQFLKFLQTQQQLPHDETNSI
ncbi:8839_t:CDS:2 [Scutellospora calospora]|uniref:8839_t:CDS:1 n=1 Tax=Scutellospora calospora TaxID=85575 RepID=A0ACA9KFX5_9GLOM|nr:8839_t:CDS:2 [Scutellospora calospora]